MTFNCEICNKTFGRKGNLNVHFKTVHLKQKPYKCDHCDKSFGEKSHLNVHVKLIHLKLKPYNCDQCDKSFGQKRDLNNHVNAVHLKLQPYNCDHCEKSFGQKGDLNTHVNTVHLNLKPFNCDQCDMSFGRNSTLDNHIKSIHLNPRPKNMSRGEKKVFDILVKLGLEFKVDFTQEKTFSDLKSYKNHCLRYDFCINLNADDEDYLLIEFDGMQHFKKVRWQNNQTDEEVEEQFRQIKRNDRIKNKYAMIHDYPLLRIKYNDNNVFETVKQFIADHSNNQFF